MFACESLTVNIRKITPIRANVEGASANLGQRKNWQQGMTRHRLDNLDSI